jgi:hypothetical protein
VSAIQLLKRNEIDEHKWDACITRSINGLLYAYSWYLDSVAENWDALVIGNYETVMPLVWLKKLGVKCLYQPYYCQQLGVFGNSLSAKTQSEFLKQTNQFFPYININLNPSASVIAESFGLKPKKNLLLDLNNPFSAIKNNYKDNHRRSIQKAVRAEVTFSEKTTLAAFQKFYLQNIDRQKESFKPQHEKIFKRLTKTAVENGSGKIYTVSDNAGNLLSGSVILFHQNRLINIISTSSAAGKSTGASHFLFDRIIGKFSDSETVLDFEGSSIPGVARFYQGFGAFEVPFYNYKTTILSNIRQRFL